MMDRKDKHIPMIPFKRENTDMISFTGEGEENHYHILSYGWHGGKPSLELLPLLRDEEIMSRGGDPFLVDLRDIEDISMRFSGPPVCTGRMVDDEYVPCPGSREPARGFSQCMECLTQDIPDPTCLFEPHCHTNPCGARFCQIPHVVYITSFRNKFKVGMTQFRRMKERTMEQGADGMLPLLLLKDRYSARYFEGRISGTLGLPQVIRSNVKFPNLVKKRDMKEIGDHLKGIKDDLMMMWEDIERGADERAVVLKDPSTFDEKPILVDDYPLDEPLQSKPKRFKGERVVGRIIGFKGSYMFFRQGNIWAYRLSEVPGMVLHSGNDLSK